MAPFQQNKSFQRDVFKSVILHILIAILFISFRKKGKYVYFILAFFHSINIDVFSNSKILLLSQVFPMTSSFEK